MSSVIIQKELSFLMIQQYSFKYNRNLLHLPATMNHKQQPIHSNTYPILLSNSIFSDSISIKKGLSTPQLGNEEGGVNFAIQSFSQLNVQDLQGPNPSGRSKHHLQINHSTSFEQINMQNHRTVLIESIRQYFQNIKHEILQKVTNPKKQVSTSDELTFKQKQDLIQHILAVSGKIDEAGAAKIVARLKDKTDQIKIITDMLSNCPKNIQFEVVYILSFLLQKCNQLIQHFTPKKLPKELKERSDSYADLLMETHSLQYLFQGHSKSKVQTSFRTLAQKWMITLFLMKVGIFENELLNKSIDDCLKSQIFKKIDLNDLLNQHLIHPFRKIAKQQ